MVRALLKNKPKEVLSCIFMMMITMGAVGISPFLADIAAAFPDKSPEQVALLMTLPSLATIFACLVVPFIWKKLGMKNTIILGLVIFTICGLIPVFVKSWGIICFSRCAIGVGAGFVNTLNNAAIFRLFDGDEQDTMLGWQQIGNDVGYIIMAISAGYLALAGWQAGFWVHIVGLVSLIITIVCFPQDMKNGKSIFVDAEEEAANAAQKAANKGKTHLTGITLSWLVLVLIFEGTLHTFSMNVSYLAVENGMGSVEAGYASTLMTVGGFIIGLFFGKLAPKLGRLTTTVGCIIDFAALMCCALVYIGAKPLIYVAGFLVGFGMVIVFSSMTAHCMRNVNFATQSLVAGFFMICINGGQFLNPYWAGFLTNTFGGGTVRGRFICSAIVELIVGIIAFFLAGKKANVNEEVAA